MNTQAHFENIQFHIKEELQKAKQSVSIAMAWFTDARLFNVLCAKAGQGVQVNLLLMNDDINNNSGIVYERLTQASGKVWKVSGSGGNDTLMHNKFCVIDEQTVLNGSYNWTNKAKQNHESITVIRDRELALQFTNEFNVIKAHYFGADPEAAVADYAKICIRLETLKNVILLEDTEDIVYQTGKLKKAIPAQDNSLSAVFTVIKEIEQKSYGNAIALITDFVTRFRSLTVFVDAEIAALRLETKVLGLQISSLEDEKADIEKLLYEFNVRHDRELGGLIMKILESRKKKLQEEAENDSSKKEKAKEAERDYKEYKQTYEDSARKVIAVLDDEQQKELKANYRKASKLCHPDVVNEKQKAQAEAVFRTLKEAYDTNDLEKVTEILANLEQGVFAAKSTEINEKKELLVTVACLRQRRDELEQELIDLKASEIYQTVSQIEDWDAYFRQMKERLEREWMSLAG